MNTILVVIMSLFVLTALALILIKTFHNPLPALLKKAQQGDSEAQYKAGLLCHAKQDYTQAFKLLETAASNGYAKAQTALASLYNAGHGCEKSTEKTFYWYECAAKQGDFEARVNLGICYLEGLGTTQNEEKGFEILKSAADDGSPLAQTLVANLYETGKGTPKDAQLSTKYYILAAKQQEPMAMQKLNALKLNKNL